MFTYKNYEHVHKLIGTLLNNECLIMQHDKYMDLRNRSVIYYLCLYK